jgi:hypothetical protein
VLLRVTGVYDVTPSFGLVAGYWALALLVLWASRRSARVAGLGSLAIPLVDMPMVTLLILSTTNAAATTGGRSMLKRTANASPIGQAPGSATKRGASKARPANGVGGPMPPRAGPEQLPGANLPGRQAEAFVKKVGDAICRPRMRMGRVHLGNVRSDLSDCHESVARYVGRIERERRA